MARIDLRKDATGVDRHFTLIPIDAEIPDDPETARVAADYETRLGTALEAVVATSLTPLDGESRQIRSSETNLGNLLADAMRAHSGPTSRSSTPVDSRRSHVRGGPLSRRELLTMQPFGNKLCKLEVPAGRSWTPLRRPPNRGRPQPGFPQVSGLTFTLDRAKPAAIGWATCASAEYRSRRIAATPWRRRLPDRRCDGYTMFANQRMLVGPRPPT